MGASLEIVQDINEQLIIDQINAGNLTLIDGVRPTPMDLVQAIALRKGGRKDSDVSVWPLVAFPGRRKQSRDRLLSERKGGAVIVVARTGGETVPQYGGIVPIRTYVECAVFAKTW